MSKEEEKHHGEEVNQMKNLTMLENMLEALYDRRNQIMESPVEYVEAALTLMKAIARLKLADAAEEIDALENL